ncbi:hypothetical protein ACFFK0_02210 [Paenibacillus chartarius]|uniref:DUF5590 domain-containing protein n=1 Tax=Paenibacillus chartarius TaxID=747481 RepID=A0ABV6DF48_9BACL
MTKKTTVLLVIVVVLLVVGLLTFRGPKPLYGNDKESIVKVIRSLKGYEDKWIEVVDYKDVDDGRMVGFLSNQSPGYIHFQKNEDGNYLWRHMEVADGKRFGVFTAELPMFIIVTNHKSKVARMQLSVNGQIVEQDFTPDQASVTWVEFPKSENNEYTFRNYSYYDQDGNIMNE